MKKNLKIIVPVALVVIAVVAVVLFLIFGKTSILTKNVEKTVATESKGYKLDLRIFGTYNNKSVNKIITVSNYKNEDKTITVSDLSASRGFNSLIKDKENNNNESINTYIIKGNKYYKLVNEKLEDTKTVPYENSDIYLEGIKKMKDVKQSTDEKIGETTYKVYKGTVSKSVINNIASYTDDKFTFDADCNVEVWLTEDNYVYKVYYRVDKMTLYASYFALGKTGKINLDEYKKEAV